MDDPGPEINEKTAWLEDSLGLAEGMNHAPLCQSSKRPGEDDEVKGLAGELEVLRPADPIPNSVGETSRKLPAGLGDETSVRVYRCDLGAHASEAKGQATVAASDLQDFLAAPACSPPQCSKLVLIGVNSKWHRRNPSYLLKTGPGHRPTASS
jgi:hypothetical protein